MVYRWDDIRDDHLEVEWGENVYPNRTRRARTLRRYNGEGMSNWLSATIVFISTLAAVGIATLVGLTLVKSPIAKREENPSNAEGLGGPLPVSTQDVPTIYPSNEPSAHPTLRPTNGPSHQPTPRPSPSPTTSPTVAESFRPSQTASTLPSTAPSVHASRAPSVSPSGVPKAPPAPEPQMCVDQPGYFRNHAGEQVSCEWFSTVGTYNYEKNCEKTDIGRACLFSCRRYSDCIVVTDSPSHLPSSPPSYTSPTVSPTPGPPKSIIIGATGDASIREDVPDANLGASSYLKLDSESLPQDLPMGTTDTGVFHVMLRFDLTGHDSSRPVESAALRLKAAKGCSSGGYLKRTHSPHWNEDAVTWDTAPEGVGTEIGSLGSITEGYWYSFDVTSTLHHGHDALSLRLHPTSSDECLFVSKEHVSGFGPELHIVYDDV